MESKSLKKFKSTLIKAIPFFPNDKKTKDVLMNQSISSVMFHYVHWVSRFIPKRPRKVFIENYATNDQRWSDLDGVINNFISKVKSGEDLTPYLSLKVHRKGYTPVDRIRNGDTDRWDDKDFLLNAMGFHHFHLGLEMDSNGISDRTNEVLFAKVTRNEFHIVALFDHSVFDSEKKDNDEMNSERSRLWDIFDEYSSRGIPPGSIYIPTMITTSGHPVHIHGITNEYIHIINQIDPKIENKEFIYSLYKEGANIDIPKKRKLDWHMNGLDLGLLDKNNNFFVFMNGPT